MAEVKSPKFGFWSIVLLGINGVIGCGIFLLPGKAMALVGPSSVWLYVVVAMMVMTISLCFAECSGKFSRNGAAYVYARAAFGEFVGFEVGIMRWAISIIAWATLAVGFVTALQPLLPEILQEPLRSVVVTSLILGLGLFNILGVRITKYLNNIITLGKLLPLFVVMTGIFFINVDNFTPVFTGIEADSFGMVSLIIFYTFTGFEALAVAAEDMENPQKNIPIALTVVMIACSIIYFFVQAVAVGVLGAALAKSNTPVADAVCAFAGPAGKWLVTVGMIISIGGINVAASFISPRSGVALARDGLIPRNFAVNGRFGTPYLAIIFTVAIAIPIALSGSFVKLAAISVISRFAQYLPTCLAVIVLRKKCPALIGTFKIPFGPVIPIIAIMICLWLLTKATPGQLCWGLGALAAGIPLYFVQKYLNRQTKNMQA